MKRHEDLCKLEILEKIGQLMKQAKDIEYLNQRSVIEFAVVELKR